MGVQFPSTPLILQNGARVTTDEQKPKRDMDEKVKIDLPPDVALEALLKVDPESPETRDAAKPEPGPKEPQAEY